MSAEIRAGKILCVLGVLAGLTTYYMLGAAGTVLSEPDEARCALIARHMAHSGDWLAPQLLDRPYFDKPPLYFWMLAGSTKLFGESEWSLRLPSAIIGAATVVLTGLLAGQFFGRAAAWLAGGTFAVSIAGITAGRVIRMDMLLALWVTAALVCWSRVALSGGDRRRWATWYFAMYLCMALGCLTKGPVAVLLPALIIGLYMLLSYRWREIPRALWSLRPLMGLLIVVVLYGSWVAYMTWRYPQYPREFFFRQNLDRFGGSGMGLDTPWYIIPGAFVGGLMPWGLFLAAAVWDRRPRTGIPPAEKLLWTWGLVVLVFFTMSKARLPNYVLPAFPSTFALLGGYLAGAGERNRRGLRIALTATYVMALAGTVVYAVIGSQRLDHTQLLRFDQVDFLHGGMRLAALGVLLVPTWLLWKRKPVLALLPFFAAYAAFTIEFAYGPAQEYFASRSSITLAAPLAHLDPAAGPISMATEPRYGAVFYAPPGWQFRLFGNHQVGQLLPMIKGSDKPFYAILTGGGLLRMLQHSEILDLPRSSERLTILQRCDADALVRIDPAKSMSEGRPSGSKSSE
jgi:4-amino-4-deoxy-L-arabinose transferase-like glycosyltransferase